MSATVWTGPDELRPYLIPLAALTPYPENERDHDDKNMEAIRQSLIGHGQVRLLVAYQGVVFAGNGRLQAMHDLGWTHAAVLPVDDVFADREQARAFAIADNRTGELSSWQMRRLASSIASLPAAMQPFTGYNEVEFGILIRSHEGWTLKETVPQAVPQHQSVVRIMFETDEQEQVIRAAISKLRNAEGDPTIKDGRALELIAAEVLT